MNGRNIAVFDIGGTWFRGGLYTPGGELIALSKRPAYNYKNTPHQDVRELQVKLVDYLADEVARLRSGNPGIDVNAAAVSMGAALNAHSGLILNSGPLWGPECKPFDLLSELKRKAPNVEWRILNDVSAALLRHVHQTKYKGQRVNLITVSSGIACRTYDVASHSIPVDKDYGIQGEIGHIPIHFSFFGKQIEQRCDCGGINHLNAFVSGRGIEALLGHILDGNMALVADTAFISLLQQGHKKSGNSLSDYFAQAVRGHDDLALEILDAVTLPIAQAVTYLLTLDPEVEKIILTGGVVHGMPTEYMTSLLKNLKRTGMYQVPEQSNFFEERLELGIDDDNSGLIGAATVYDEARS